jgi:hypothetical protein
MPLTLEELTEMAKAGLGSTSWVNIFAVGKHRPGDRNWTRADLDAVVRNFRLNSHLHEAPIGLGDAALGHSEEQELLRDSGLPRAGRVVALRRRGDVLQAIFNEVPRAVAEAIRYRLYAAPSAELYEEASEYGLKGHGPALRRVAFLGFDIPAVKRLGRLDPIYYSERSAAWAWPIRPAGGAALPGRRWLTYSEFAEGSPMDEAARNALMATVQAKWPELTAEFLAGLDDEQLAALAQLAAGGVPAGAAAPAEMQEGEPAADRPPRAEQEQAIIAAGLATAEELATMTDDEVWELYQQATGTAAAPAEATMSERQTRRPSVRPVALFAEMRRQAALIEVRQRRLEAGQRALERDQRRRQQAERAALVRAYCERWLRERKISPAEADERATVPNLYGRLLAASGTAIRRYGERSYSEFEAAVAEVEQRPPGFARLFAEKIPAALPAGAGGSPGALTAERRRELLSYTATGRAILKGEPARAHQPVMLPAATHQQRGS